MEKSKDEKAHLIVESNGPLSGTVDIVGAKNAVLVIMASLILTRGTSTLRNVPCSQDVLHMIALLEQLGAQVVFEKHNHLLIINTAEINRWHVSQQLMQKMRASVLVMGPLLTRFGVAEITLPGGCAIGARPIDYHLKNFQKMGINCVQDENTVRAHTENIISGTYVLEYPSVGATENILMASICAPGQTRIVNAALEPEVEDLIAVLSKMGAKIKAEAPATIVVSGVDKLQPIAHDIMPDRLEAGAFLLAAAMTGGDVMVRNVRPETLAVFLLKLEEMGHVITTDAVHNRIRLSATDDPIAVSFKTGPYPGFPTDLQAPMMALQTVARGTSVIEETVFENRLLHVKELQKMGAQIEQYYTKAIVTGVKKLYGARVQATDIRASCALLLAGLVADGQTRMFGLAHFKRGYEKLDHKLNGLGACIIQSARSKAMQIAVTMPQEAGV